MHPAYRKDIDGLRALAVIPVILFHADVSFFQGGYVGVDIFFVISGYLITLILYREVQLKEFSIANFYERRIRRILPVLFAVMAFCFVVGWLVYSPDEFQRLAKSIKYTTIFWSNSLFARKTGYFDTGAEHEALLHTWSLSVEEQYYIIFPLIFFAISKYLKSSYFLCLSLIFILSLALSVYGVQVNPHEAFFSTQMRAWELISGGFIALNVLPELSNRRIKNILSLTGFFCIAISVFLFDSSTVFPGFSALLPTLGAALIIYSGLKGGNELLVGKLLSLRPVVFIGAISYSLYMWHWPLIVFAKHIFIRPLTVFEIAALLTVIGCVSILSWKYIEQPFRKSSLPSKRRKLFYTTLWIMLAAVALSLLVKVNDGFPSRIDIHPVNDVEWDRVGKCSKELKETIQFVDTCSIGVTGIEPSFILWGDSHARAIATGVRASASRNGVSGKIATIDACPPLLGVGRPDVNECLDFNQSVFDYIVNHPELETIILSARWAINAKGDRYKEESGTKVVLIDTDSGVPVGSDNAAIFDIALKRTVAKLLELKRRVVIVSQVPEVGYNVPSAYFVTKRTNRDLNAVVAPTVVEYERRNESVMKTFDDLGERNVTILDPWKVLCGREFCSVKSDFNLLYRDTNHLSSYGSNYISTIFSPLFFDEHK